MNTIPDSLPVLSEGNHDDPSEGGCFMEWVSVLAGEEWSDHPACTHPVLAELARCVNDRLPDSERQRIVHLIPSVIGTADTREDAHARRVLSVRLAVWCARQVVDLVPDQDRAACVEALDVTEAWTRGEATSEQRRRGDAYAADYAANAANAAYAAANDNAAAYAVYAATYAADATYAARPDRLIGLLAGCIAEHARLTGHQPAPITADQWS